MKTLNVTLVIDPSIPLGNYYLEYLFSAGFLPKHILIMKKGLKHKLRTTISKYRKALTYKKASDHKAYNKLLDNLNDQFKLKVKQHYNYNEYCEEVVYIDAKNGGPNSENVIDYISRSDVNCYIFSGGGILRNKLLSIPNKKFLHVHPGIVPDIKGSDCFFWSVLERGVPGYTCFYMSPEIDEGDILYQKEYDLSKLKFTTCVNKPDLEYRAILNSVDLHYRADCLLTFINCNAENVAHLDQISSTKQNPKDGRTYFLMHQKLRLIALNKVYSLSEVECYVSE